MPDLKVAHIYSKVFESSIVAIGVTDLQGNYIKVNPAWCEFLGYTAEEALKLNVRDVTVKAQRNQSDISLKKLITGEVASIRKTRQYKRKNGRIFWADLHVSPLIDHENKIVGVIGMLVNIDRQVKAEHKQKELNAKLNVLARHDALTGLYNRRAIEEVLEREHRRAKRYSRGLAVAIADLDDFKKINDKYGHNCGDMVLKHLAKTFLHWIRDTDSVGRWGGEEFLFVFSETSCEGAQIVAERIRSSLNSQEFICGENSLKLSITIGISYRIQQVSIEDMIHEADNALYYGKSSGKNQVVCNQC